jgi:hypothetical protein
MNTTAVPRMVWTPQHTPELLELLGQDVRKVLITTIHNFGEASGRLNERSNIIVPGLYVMDASFSCRNTCCDFVTIPHYS